MGGHSRAKEIRERRGLTVVELAALTGLARQTIYNVEQQLTPRPSADVVVKIARALDVTVEELLEPEAVA